MPFTVGEASRLTGITIRALHHYDEIGLCRPSQRTLAGYRLYDEDDLLRLQQVLVFRELGVPLAEIADVIATGGRREELLRRHREALVAKRTQLDAMVASIDAALDHLAKGPTTMTDESLQQMFEGFDPTQYEAEVQERWGDTDAYRESARRTKQYGAADWQQIKDEAAAIGGDLAALLGAGVPASDPRTTAVVERHRLHIERWFYACSIEMQRQLGEMYVDDLRFAANLDKLAPGLAVYWRDAIRARP